jgi:putative acetyltransferase
MRIRRERTDDVDTVRDIVATAFARPDTAPGAVPVEVTLLDGLRADAGWLPALSLVALDGGDGGVIGHVVCTRGTVDGRPAWGSGLSPYARTGSAPASGWR